MRKWSLGIAASILVLAGAAQSQPAPKADYHLVRTIPIGAPDRWDYVVFDAPSKRIYVAHGPNLTAVDPVQGKVIGTLVVGGATHGAAIAQGKGYTDDGKSGFVVVFDPASLKELRRIKATPDADGIVYDPASKHILVIGGDSGKVTVIDPATDKAVATIDGGGPLEFGVLDGNGKFYVDGEDRNEIVRIDLARNIADAHWPFAACKTPHGLAIDRQNKRLFASCGNKVMEVMDARTGASLARLPIGEGSDFAVFDNRRGLAFSSNREGTLSIVTQTASGHYGNLPPVTTARGGRTMAIDQDSGRLYVVASDVTAGTNGKYAVVPGSAKLMVFEPNP